MQKLMSAVFSILGGLMLGISGLWLISSVIWFWTIFEKYQSVLGLFIALLLIFSGLFLCYKFPKRCQACYRWFMRHKIILVIAALVVQVLLLLSANMMIRSDAAVVFNGAIKQLPELAISSYLSRNPNNLMLFLYERFFYKIFAGATIWILQILNIGYTHLAGYFLYRAGQRYFSQVVADRTFIFYYLLVLLTPKFMAMYTDVMVLPILAIQLYVLLDLLNRKSQKYEKWKYVLLGLLTGLGLAFRPTVAIIVIAFFTVYWMSHSWKKTVTCLSLFSLGFGASYGSLNFYKNHQEEVVIMTEDGLSKNMLTFINLGLTYSGTDQVDMKKGLLQYIPKSERNKYNNGLFKNEYQIAEIKRRLQDYNVLTFTEHVLYKQYKTTGQGNLNWIYKSKDGEKSTYMSPLSNKNKDSQLTQWIRDYLIYTDQPKYQFYDYTIQFVWVLLSLGLFLFFCRKTQTDSEKLLSLSLFGGLLFLQIFEGGKSRYLIQFLPQILFIAAIGWSNWTCKVKRLHHK